MRSFKADEAWVVEADDHEWFGQPEDVRAAIVTMTRDAAKAEKCTSFAIFSVPDPIFPVYGHSIKKRVHSEQIDTGASFHLSCTHHAEIPRDHWEAISDVAQSKLLKRLHDILSIKGATNPGRYEIYIPNGDGTNTYLERGKLP
jgi:hypothetical protein